MSSHAALLRDGLLLAASRLDELARGAYGLDVSLRQLHESVSRQVGDTDAPEAHAVRDAAVYLGAGVGAAPHHLDAAAQWCRALAGRL